MSKGKLLIASVFHLDSLKTQKSGKHTIKLILFLADNYSRFVE